MIVYIWSDAEQDLIEGSWFYERQSIGLGDYFRSCLISDIELLAFFGGTFTDRFQSDSHLPSIIAWMETPRPLLRYSMRVGVGNGYDVE